MNIEAMLAEIRAEMRHLREDVAEIKEEQNIRHDRADHGRAKVHERLDRVAERVGSLEGQSAALRDTVTDMKNVTDEVRRWKIMGMTSLSIAGIGAAAFGVTFSDAIKRLVHLLTIR